MTRSSGGVDQKMLRQCIGLSSSYLVSDVTTNPESGLNSWFTGFSRLVDVLAALHAREELELETISEASKACSECWTVAGAWREMSESRECIRVIAVKLKSLLDANGQTYRGGRVYVP